jgi:hypothetical protein
MNGLGNIDREPLEAVLRHAWLANETGVIP